MKVLFLATPAPYQVGPGDHFEAGQVYDLAPRSARRWLERGIVTDDARKIAGAERSARAAADRAEREEVEAAQAEADRAAREAEEKAREAAALATATVSATSAPSETAVAAGEVQPISGGKRK